MATTDQEIVVQRELAQYAYDKKEEYGVTNGLTREAFMYMYDQGEITLSTVFENLFVTINNAQGGDVKKVSEDARDFSNDGDMKIGVLKKDGYRRRYVVSSCKNKVGTIYFVGWNWMTHKPEFHAIPKDVYGSPSQGIKIMRHPTHGTITSGKYNACAYNTFEEITLA